MPNALQGSVALPQRLATAWPPWPGKKIRIARD